MTLVYWALYFPLLKLIGWLAFWLPEYQERKRFEEKNLTEDVCLPFKDQGLKADLCFEFSSEGEYQQVASLIQDALDRGKLVELIFFSPSVEKTILALAHKYPGQVRCLRFPLLTLRPWRVRSSLLSWVSAPKLILVRYDLFPEFLVWAKGEGNELIMLWVSFKKERSSGKEASRWKLFFLRLAKKRFYASLLDQKMGEGLGVPGECYDFRMEQIRRRVEGREGKFAETFPQYADLRERWESYPRSKRLLIGNAWPSDLFLFQELPEDLFVLVVPHKLSPEVFAAYERALSSLGRGPVEIGSYGSVPPVGDTFLLNRKGVLCELYHDFGLAYVGGGFEAGVHSVLEPLVAGTESIACGKLHHRSTEFDLALDLGRVRELRSPQDLVLWSQAEGKPSGRDLTASTFGQYANFRKDVIGC